MSKNVIIAIVVIVIIIAGVVWYMNQADTTDVVDNGGEVVDTSDNGTGSFTTDGDDTTATDGTVDAGADAAAEVSAE